MFLGLVPQLCCTHFLNDTTDISGSLVAGGDLIHPLYACSLCGRTISPPYLLPLI